MEIRKAKLSDVNELFRLEKLYNIEHELFSIPLFKIIGLDELLIKKAFCKKIRSKKDFFIVLDSGSRLKGYLFGEISVNKMEKHGYFHKKTLYGYLENVFVEKSSRGKGYFTQMYGWFLDYLKSKKIKYCRLHVASKNPMYNQYEKLGFESEDIRMIKKI